MPLSHSGQRFQNRNEAGQMLARHLQREVSQADLIVIALPRGGVVIGYEIARLLEIPLEILIIRKLGAPHQPELAVGAVASGGFRYLNQELIDQLAIDQSTLVRLQENALHELERREDIYKPHAPSVSLRGHQVLLVDDGIATGASIEVALRAIKAVQPAGISIAVPVATLGVIEKLHREVNHIYALQTPFELGSIGEFYEEFEQVSDEEVIKMLDEVNRVDSSA